MFASSQRIDFARNLIEPLIEEEVKNREKIKRYGGIKWFYSISAKSWNNVIVN